MAGDETHNTMQLANRREQTPTPLRIPAPQDRTQNPHRQRFSMLLLGLWLDQFSVNCDGDIVADHARSAIHAKVFAIDLG